jgi:hypothetical protein
MSQGRKSLAIMPGCPMEPKAVRRDSRDFAVHGSSCALAPSSFFADGWPAFLVPNAFVEDLPNQTTQPVGDGADRMGVAEARDEPAIHDREDRTLGLHAVLAA